MKKKILALFLSAILFNSVFGVSGNDSQIIQAGHWIYNAMYNLASELKLSMFLDNQPMTIGELKYNFKEIDYEKLSLAGKEVYNRTKDFLFTSSDFMPDSDLRFFINPKFNGELYYKTNKNIDWTFDYFIKDRAVTIPILIGFSNYVTLESDFFLGKNYIEIHKERSFTNIPYNGDQMEFLFPRFAYGSTAYTGKDWGINFHVGKEGLSIGNTELGSIIYNRTFETDFYAQLNIFASKIKYSGIVSQVDIDKYFYLHQLNFRPFKNLKLGILEGSLLNSSFELRYLNPIMAMHSFGSWTQYDSLMNDVEQKYYGEGHFCAYLGFTFEFMPVSNMRIYGLYAQNEILDLGGSRSDSALSVPDSLGGQLGIQYNIPIKDQGFLELHGEILYTSPYLYVKQSPDWSLYKVRSEMQTSGQVHSWMGSPYGPDSFVCLLGSKFNSKNKWECSFNYEFAISGMNKAENLFSEENYKTVEDSEERKIWTYYPSVEYDIASSDEEKQAAKEKGRYMWMTGTPEFTNKLSLSGQYNLKENFMLYAQCAYSFIFNNKNVLDNFQQGFQIALGCEYKLF